MKRTSASKSWLITVAACATLSFGVGIARASETLSSTNEGTAAQQLSKPIELLPYINYGAILMPEADSHNAFLDAYPITFYWNPSGSSQNTTYASNQTGGSIADDMDSSSSRPWSTANTSGRWSNATNSNSFATRAFHAVSSGVAQ